MAADAGPPPKKAQIAVSSVHDEFCNEQIPDPKKEGKLKDIRVCKLCEFVFENKTISVLKTHLERKHTEAHNQRRALLVHMYRHRRSSSWSLVYTIILVTPLSVVILAIPLLKTVFLPSHPMC